MIDENSVQIDNEIEKNELELEENGNSILFVSKNNNLLALIGVKDIVRDGIKETIEKIKSKNIDVIMLTGDNEKTAKVIAKV